MSDTEREDLMAYSILFPESGKRLGAQLDTQHGLELEYRREIKDLKAMVKHCEDCGGSWVDYGLQDACYCTKIKKLVENTMWQAEVITKRGNVNCQLELDKRYLEAQLAELQRKNEELRDACNTYAIHFDSCRGGKIIGVDALGINILTVCTCGLDKALGRLTNKQESGNET